jgi:hypothetical protein
MHSGFALNTIGGQWGFRCVYPDGSTFDEREGYWDHVSREREILRVELVHFPSDAVVATCAGWSRYFFGNESLGAGGAPGVTTVQTAKMLGGGDPGGAYELARVEWRGLAPDGKRFKGRFDDLPLGIAAIRPGVPGWRLVAVV